jgi:hypothetical protein
MAIRRNVRSQTRCWRKSTPETSGLPTEISVQPRCFLASPSEMASLSSGTIAAMFLGKRWAGLVAPAPLIVARSGNQPFQCERFLRVRAVACRVRQSSCRPRAEEAELTEILENRGIHIELGFADSLAWPFPRQMCHLAQFGRRKTPTRREGAARTLVRPPGPEGTRLRLQSRLKPGGIRSAGGAGKDGRGLPRGVGGRAASRAVTMIPACCHLERAGPGVSARAPPLSQPEIPEERSGPCRFGGHATNNTCSRGAGR